ncbi:fmt [Wigglesworthia glossinidia endosymbiont of Glossina brevipalpis]|uniref:Methionyl-tRNA formyltransferase n=1 Tax=Wigglesworthia glossinidia brevipalpis TaxID=36870 RepID=FMT_WIGBR|nr:RecName: Full=Methionyl-tRNA formyltransferase [Wigglesworthia glossinidia endosymbiont of Glossina brevipalpis]BAC24641.1 fmt [Wigglesworthia glossinidia endosymbiont of Glossina brevipalpis]
MNSSKSLRIVFAGTSQFSYEFLYALLESRHVVVGILANPDRFSGRGHKIKFSPVKKLAKYYNIKILQPDSTESLDNLENDLKKMRCDIIIVVSYSIILSKKILSLPRLGCINLHSSLLPRWRGAAPIHRALQSGDKTTGITIIKMNDEIDTGPILYKRVCSIQDTDTTETLLNKLSIIGKAAIIQLLHQISIGKYNLQYQNNSIATYAKKINKKEAKINWNLPAINIDRNIRAFNPWPVSYFWISGKYIRAWKAKIDINNIFISDPGKILNVNSDGIHVGTGKGILILEVLQLSGKKRSFVKESLCLYKKLFITGNIIQ